MRGIDRILFPHTHDDSKGNRTCEQEEIFGASAAAFVRLVRSDAASCEIVRSPIPPSERGPLKYGRSKTASMFHLVEAS
jgi:hypothetical protein